MDWSSAATQQLRFLQLLRLCDFSRPFSLNDFGCGYGALLGWLRERHPDAAVDYLGIDVSRHMVETARRLWRGIPRAAFRTGRRSPREADYSVASGVFNVKLDAQREDWEALVRGTLNDLAATSRRGFAVNFLDLEPAHLAQAPQLYRTDPQPWVAHCEALGWRTRLAGGYGLNEFTLLAERG